MNSQILLAKRYLFRGKAKHISFISLVACLGITLGIGTLIIVMSVMNGFDQDLTERLLRFNYHITVESYNQDHLNKIAEKIKGIKGLDNTALYIHTQIFAKFDSSIMPITVKGLDFKNPKEWDNVKKYITTDYGNEGFLIGEGLHKRFYILDTIEYYPLKKKMESAQEAVRGFFQVGIYDIDNSVIIADLEKVKGLSPNYLIFLGIRVKDAFAVEGIKDEILKCFPKGVTVVTWKESNRVLFSAIKLEKYTMFIILSLIILVASFNIFGTLTVKVVEKTKDIGVLKSLGFSNKKILNIFCLQGALLGIIGIILGAIFGLTICFLLKKYPIIPLPEEVYSLRYLPVSINWQDIICITGVGFIISIISSLIPAFRASKLLATEALRYE